MKLAISLLVVAAIVIGIVFLSADRADSYDWNLPDDIPAPKVPISNPMSDIKVELGRWLFYDKRLSANDTMSCGTCHLQYLAFTDARARSIGSTGQVHPRSSMSLVNIAYASRLTWANPLLDKLEDQALIPLLGEEPVEMGMAGRSAEIGELLRSDTNYKGLAAQAFPSDENPYSMLNAVRSIAAFVRSIVSFESPYDNYLRGDSDVLSPAQHRGMALFFSERLECFHCHGGFNFTDSSTHSNSNVDRVGFHNTALYNLDGGGAYPKDNTGLFDMTGAPRDMGRFKAPSLRNIAVSAPYMHDGSIANLSDVIDHYARGGRKIDTGPNRGDGRLSPFKSEFISGFTLSDEERRDLIEFLHALTDDTVLTEERWSNPYPQPE